MPPPIPPWQDVPVNALPVPSLHNSLPQPQPPAPAGPMGPAPPMVGAPPSGGGPPAWLNLLPMLFAVGARTAGAPTVGTGALQGFQQGQLLLQEQQQRRTAEQQRQQQIDQQAAEMALRAEQLVEAQRIQAEQRRQAAINSSVDNLRAQQFGTKADYDAAVSAHETMLQNAYGVRPNTLRAMVPYVQPSIADKMTAELDRIAKTTPELLQNPNAFIEADWDGDGVVERRQVREIFRAAGRAVVTDKDGKPIVLAKGQDGSAFQVALSAKVERFKVEKGREPNAKEYDALVEEARRTPPDPTLQAIRDLTLQNARSPQAAGLSPAMEANVLNRLVTQWTAASKTSTDLKRSLTLMDAGLDAARRGDLAQASQAILVTFQKILDPTSVVRESEYMRSAAGLSLLTRVQGATERIVQGGAGVPLSELEKFAQLARQAAAVQLQALEPIKERIGRQADRYRIPRELIFEDSGGVGASPPPAGEPTVGQGTGAPPKAGDIVLIGGKRMRVTQVFPDGTFNAEIVR